MSMVQELIAAVTNAERQIDDQIMKLQSYVGEIDKVTQRVDSAFGGSGKEFGKQMLQQLSMTKTQVNDTLGRLQEAKIKLVQVRMI